jgi:hypothetical protein
MSAKEKERSKEKTNATSRLSVVLDAMAHAEGNSIVTDVLASALQITDNDNNRASLLAFAVLTRMIESAEKEAHLYYSDEWDTLGPHFSGVRACFTPRKSGLPWNQQKSSLTAADLTGIKHTAMHLKRHVHENLVMDTDTVDITNAIEQMSLALDDELLSKHTRDVLRERLDAIKKALDEYRFWGAAGIDQTYREFVGTIISDSEVRTDLANSGTQEESLGKKTMNVVRALDTLLHFATAAYNAGKYVLPIIERFILPTIGLSSN